MELENHTPDYDLVKVSISLKYPGSEHTTEGYLINISPDTLSINKAQWAMVENSIINGALTLHYLNLDGDDIDTLENGGEVIRYNEDWETNYIYTQTRGPMGAYQYIVKFVK